MPRKSNFEKLAGENQVEHIRGIMYKIEAHKRLLLETNDEVVRIISKLSKEVKPLYEKKLLNKFIQEIDGFDAAEYRDEMLKLKAGMIKIDQLERGIKRETDNLLKILKRFFRVNEQLKYSCDVDFENGTVHLYSFLPDKDVVSDKNHGHYGIDFDKKIVFIREWGNRNDKKNITETFKIESFLALKNAS